MSEAYDVSGDCVKAMASPTSNMSATVGAMATAAVVTSGASGITSNPRKFSEKIALHNQKADEEKSEFEKIMKDLKGIKKQGNGVSTNITNLPNFPLFDQPTHES